VHRGPAPIRQIRAGGQLEGRYTAGFSRTPFRLACRTRAVWQYRPVPSLSGLLPTLNGASRTRLPPASPGCCDSPATEPSHPRTVSRRLVALDVGHPETVRARGSNSPRAHRQLGRLPDAVPPVVDCSCLLPWMAVAMRVRSHTGLDSQEVRERTFRAGSVSRALARAGREETLSGEPVLGLDDASASAS
jgi:hypothetical protein